MTYEEAGRQDFKLGIPFYACPFAVRSAARQRWQHGWLKAAEKPCMSDNAKLDATLARVAIALNETWQHQPATALNEEEE